MQLLVIQFTIKMFDLGFVQVLTLYLIKSVFITDCIYGHHTDLLHANCSNKIILADFIVNGTILMF